MIKARALASGDNTEMTYTTPSVKYNRALSYGKSKLKLNIIPENDLNGWVACPDGLQQSERGHTLHAIFGMVRSRVMANTLHH